MAHQGRRNQCQLGPGPINQAHHRSHNAFKIRLGKADQQIVGQGGQSMDQCLAGVPLGREAKAGHEFAQLGAHPWHLGRRRSQTGTGPDAGVDRQRLQLSAIKHRDNEQVERCAAVNIADMVGLDHQRPALGPALAFEPGKGAFIGNRAQQALGTPAANAQRVRLGPIAMAQDVAQLGQHAVLEPTQQRGPFAVGQAIGVIRHRRLHLWPIGNGCTNIGEGGAQRGFQSATDLRIGTASLDIDHRFALFTRCPTLWNLCQHTIRRAAHRQDRVDQPINRQPLRSQGRGDRIDQKGHVIIDHANPHEALGSRA